MSNGVSLPPHPRASALHCRFVEAFGVEPAFWLRVPGRVNLIGEHIDYCGYPVMPMAIEHDVLVAALGIPNPILHVVNSNRQYEDYKGVITTPCQVEGKPPKWYEYVLCGVFGASQAIFGDSKPNGIMIAISGNIPVAAGLSSSSALVCAATYAMFHSNDFKINKMEIASLCAHNERLIGTEGGGMDQAIAFLANEGCAQYISWNPLTVVPVMLPKNAVCIVAHSLAEMNKAATQHFNNRVRECTLAAQLIAYSNGLVKESKNDKLTLSEVQKLLGIDLNKMKKLALNLPQDNGSFKIRDRATHVIEEALRVEKFRDICDNLQNDCNWEEELGNLMYSSHKSLAELYECSHPFVDKIVELSNKFGVKARITGAGWGGCVVALCAKDKAKAYVDMLIKEYYSIHAKDRDFSELIFITYPQQGAIVY